MSTRSELYHSFGLGVVEVTGVDYEGGRTVVKGRPSTPGDWHRACAGAAGRRGRDRRLLHYSGVGRAGGEMDALGGTDPGYRTSGGSGGSRVAAAARRGWLASPH
jgi:hypothetical protein